MITFGTKTTQQMNISTKKSPNQISQHSNQKILVRSESCSTFLLKKGNSFLIGHNLDDGNREAVPGNIFINKRGKNKKSIFLRISHLKRTIRIKPSHGPPSTAPLHSILWVRISLMGDLMRKGLYSGNDLG